MVSKMGRLLGLVASMAMSATAWASPETSTENTCNAGGQGLVCDSSEDCTGNSLAQVCIQQGQGADATKACEIACQTGSGEANPALCGAGETCRQSVADGIYYCHRNRFRMDLNLLDSCVLHFLDGFQPTITTGPTCSLEQHLNRMLDQDNDSDFDIFDVDQCVQAFLNQPACVGPTVADPAAALSCEDELDIYCDVDAPVDSDYSEAIACGRGSYCDEDTNRCVRDCGVVFVRGVTDELAPLDRQCFGDLKTCNHAIGKCEDVSVQGLTCEIDQHCPAGAYCLMGECAPKCSQNIDCPGSDWYCATNNTCKPVPVPSSDANFVFEPQNYAVQFSTKKVELTDIQNEISLPLLVMDLETKAQVIDNPAVVFGYRVKVDYLQKNDSKCNKKPGDCDDCITCAELDDCTVTPSEEFVVVNTPIGTVNAQGDPALGFQLNTVAASRLSQGRFNARVTMYFNNGSSTSVLITYNKALMSGEYIGQVSPYVSDPSYNLGALPVGLHLYVDETTVSPADNPDPPITENCRLAAGEDSPGLGTVGWSALLEENNMDAFDYITDLNEGLRVTGYIHGNESVYFNQPGALTAAQNEIPVKGIYSPASKRMRLIGVIDLAADYCRGEQGLCNDDAEMPELQVKNVFGRTVRRVFEFNGMYYERDKIFTGMYRETIKGLLPSEFTLDGGFRIKQASQDEAGVQQPEFADLMAPNAPSADFPMPATVKSNLDTFIEEVCSQAGGQTTTTQSEFDNALAHFGNSAAYQAYIGGLDTATWGADRVFVDGQRFGERVQEALLAIGTSDSQAVSDATLTIQDYLQGQAGLCATDDAADEAMSCVDQTVIACGLALYQKAILGVEGDLFFQPPTGPLDADGDELFCEGGDQRPNCTTTNSALVSYQEHNRFYREMSQALTYSAQNELADALFTLVRKANGALESYSAFGYKNQKLLSAMKRYDELRSLVFSTTAAQVWYAFPMQNFKTRGRALLDQVHGMLAQRMDVLTEVMDLKRRYWANVDSQDFMFVQHLLHEEYLVQALMMWLQSEWEGDGFAYLGEGAKILLRGHQILHQVTTNRNPLGITAEKVFFESNDIGEKNWRYYRSLILEGPPSGGMLAATNEAVAGAVENLKAALRNRQEFESEMLAQRQQYEEEIDALCGDPLLTSRALQSCILETPGQLAATLECSNQQTCESRFAFNCGSGDSDCVRPARDLFSELYANDYDEGHCNMDLAPKGLEYESTCGDTSDCSTIYGPGFFCSKVDESDLRGICARHCEGGEMGALMLEQQELKLEQDNALQDIKNYLNQMKRTLGAFNDDEDDARERRDAIAAYNFFMGTFDTAIVGLEISRDLTESVEKASKCIVIGGFAVGTNCPQSAIAGTFAASAKGALGAVEGALVGVKGLTEFGHQLHLEDIAIGEMERAHAQELADMNEEMSGMWQSYEELVLQERNVRQTMDDVLYRASRARDRYQEQVTDLVDHLIGNQEGNVLVRNQYVMDANEAFRLLLLNAYKMTMALVYEYNLKGAPAPYNQALLENRLYALMTPADVEDFIDELDLFEATYCGLEGIDCDSEANMGVLRFSVRDELFPQLRDKVDPHTGRVLTKGQQFHNLITSHPFLKKRTRSGVSGLVNQVEIPFSIWANEQDTAEANADGWMLSPFECNHLLGFSTQVATTIHAAGNIAIFYTGQNLQQLKTEIWRGDTDYLRACRSQQVTPAGGGIPVTEFPVNIYKAGYAPQSDQAQLTEPPTLVTHTGYLDACQYDASLGSVAENSQSNLSMEDCFHYFARDRSLASPDWKLVLPLGYASDNDWIMNDGVPDDDKAIIEDIVLYLRHRSRPVGDQ